MQPPVPAALQAAPAPVVLITRPQPAAERFAGQIADLGLTAVLAPLMRIVPVAHDPAVIAAAQGVVLTSENAVPFAGAGRGRPAICVGPRTAQQAAAAGFRVTQGPGDAAGMMPMLADLGPGWLHVRGAEVAAELPLPGIVVYRQQALALSQAARALVQGTAPVILPLFSPRAAALAAAVVTDSRAPLWIVPISAAAAAAWDGAAPPGAASRRSIAPTPDATGVRRAIEELLGTQSRGAG